MFNYILLKMFFRKEVNYMVALLVFKILNGRKVSVPKSLLQEVTEDLKDQGFDINGKRIEQ